MNKEKKLTGQEREDRIKAISKEFDTLVLTASEENFEGERLDAILREFEMLDPTTEEEKAMFDPEKGMERLDKRLLELEREKYTLFYDLVVAEENRIKNEAIADNYRLCKALAACYELQDYLANLLAGYPEENAEDTIQS